MSVEILTIDVPGIPQTKGSARGFGFIRKTGPRAGKIGVAITNDNPSAKEWQARIAYFARQSMVGGTTAQGVTVDVTFKFTRPKSHLHTGKRAGEVKATAPERHRQKPDIDKLLRVVLDALTGVVWDDDAQVFHVDMFKGWADPGKGAGATVVVRCGYGGPNG